jgi:DNA polymerase I-like protein with 3'-5' exonuclease and polymerase domains
MGPAKLYADLNSLGFKVTRNEATQLYKDYCEKFKPAVGFLRGSGSLASRQGWLANLNGRRRYWKLPEGDHFTNPKYKAHIAAIEREGGNFKIQSVNADLTKLSMTLIRHEKKKLGYDVEFINQVYDEVVTETSEKHTKEWHPIKQRLMREAGERWIKKVPVVVEGDVGPSWTK